MPCLICFPHTQPPTAACKMETQSEHARIAYTFPHVLRRFCMLGRCLPTKISASELCRKFIRSALLVGDGLSRYQNPHYVLLPLSLSQVSADSTGKYGLEATGTSSGRPFSVNYGSDGFGFGASGTSSGRPFKVGRGGTRPTTTQIICSSSSCSSSSSSCKLNPCNAFLDC